jgi:hypothetical protein
LAFTLKWYGEQLLSGLRKVVSGRLDDAGAMVAERMRQNVSVPAPPHSAPGEYPHLVSGELRAKIFVRREFLGMRTVVGCDDPKALWLEFGTRYMAARPFIKRSWLEMEQKVRSHVTLRIPGRLW